MKKIKWQIESGKWKNIKDKRHKANIKTMK